MTSIEYSEDPKMRMAQKVVFWTVIVLAGVTAFGMLFGLLIQFLWNATLVPLFEVSSISFWQAVGIFILAKIVFGFGSGSGHSSSKGKKGKKNKAKEEESVEAIVVEDVSGDSKDVADLGDDASFRKYWQDEGRHAYETFQAHKADLDKD
jgi:hypothetical protein